MVGYGRNRWTDRTLTDAQIAAVFEGILTYSPRTADLAVLNQIGPTVDNVARYIWDHHLGEPVDPSLKEISDAIDGWLATQR